MQGENSNGADHVYINRFAPKIIYCFCNTLSHVMDFVQDIPQWTKIKISYKQCSLVLMMAFKNQLN